MSIGGLFRGRCVSSSEKLFVWLSVRCDAAWTNFPPLISSLSLSTSPISVLRREKPLSVFMFFLLP